MIDSIIIYFVCKSGFIRGGGGGGRVPLSIDLHRKLQERTKIKVDVKFRRPW